MECDKNPQKIKQIFDNISAYYDKMNNFISLGMHYQIKKNALKLLNIKPYKMVLDICCGSGDFTKIISQIQPKARTIGLDNSKNMLKIAKSKNPKCSFILADAVNLPFKEDEFDYVTIGFGLRNIEQREIALAQIRKVLKPDGLFLHLDFGYHNLASKIFDKIVPFMVKKLDKNKEEYNYLLQSKNTYPEPDELIKEFEKHGLRCVKKRDYLFGAISVQIMQKIC